MMPHLDEGVVQALLDGELHGTELARARRHLAGCEACTASYEGARESARMLTSALSKLDVQVPRIPARFKPPSVAARRGGWSVRSPAGLARAAAVLVAFATAASATIPGSPVRNWITAQLQPDVGTLALEERLDSAAGASVATMDAAVESGVSVEPRNGELRIVLTRPAPDLQIRAQLTDAPRGGVYLSDAATARFNSRAGLVEVLDAAGAEVRVEIPRRARSASIEIDGRIYLVKEGDRLNLIAASDDSLAAEIVFRAQQ